MSKESSTMKPQDILVLLKIIACGEKPWFQIPMAKDLGLAQSEMSRSIARSKYAGLLDATGRKVRRLALMDFIEYGLTYVFPQRPGSMVRGVPTSHSASPLKEKILSDENFVWPYASGTVKGQAVTPLYKSVPEAVQSDPMLHELLALVDAIRLGSSREKAIAITELKQRVLGE